jgi:phosphoglycolate phosphatase
MKGVWMARNYQLIVFDWDGTLMDSAAFIANCIQAAARDLDVAVPSDQQARYIIGLGLIDALRHALPDLPESRYAEAAERYRHHFLVQDTPLALFSGIRELLDELVAADYRLAVATGKARRGLDRALADSGLEPIFHATRCADECHSKPHPQMLEELIEELGASPETTLMIGDTTHDLLMAKNARTQALAVAYGAHPRDALEAESPVYCASDVGDLAAWLRQNA